MAIKLPLPLFLTPLRSVGASPRRHGDNCSEAEIACPQDSPKGGAARKASWLRLSLNRLVVSQRRRFWRGDRFEGRGTACIKQPQKML